VIKELTNSKSIFRVVALSATPGSDLNAVRLVLQNLQISNIELRNEESPDIVPYTFQRSIEKVVVPLGNELKKVKMDFLSILEPFIRRLAKLNILSRNSIDPTHYTKFGLLQSRNEFRQNPPAA
jgi:Fanconi anemia group M protein